MTIVKREIESEVFFYLKYLRFCVFAKIAVMLLKNLQELKVPRLNALKK